MRFTIDLYHVAFCVLTERDQQPIAVFRISQSCEDRIPDLIEMWQRDVGLAFEFAFFHQTVGKHVVSTKQYKPVFGERSAPDRAINRDNALTVTTDARNPRN